MLPVRKAAPVVRRILQIRKGHRNPDGDRELDGEQRSRPPLGPRLRMWSLISGAFSGSRQTIVIHRESVNPLINLLSKSTIDVYRIVRNCLFDSIQKLINVKIWNLPAPPTCSCAEWSTVAPRRTVARYSTRGCRSFSGTERISTTLSIQRDLSPIRESEMVCEMKRVRVVSHQPR